MHHLTQVRPIFRLSAMMAIVLAWQLLCSHGSDGSFTYELLQSLDRRSDDESRLYDVNNRSPRLQVVMRARRTSITTKQAPATISIDPQHTLRCRYVALRDYKPAFKGAFLVVNAYDSCQLPARNCALYVNELLHAHAWPW